MPIHDFWGTPIEDDHGVETILVVPGWLTFAVGMMTGLAIAHVLAWLS